MTNVQTVVNKLYAKSEATKPDISSDESGGVNVGRDYRPFPVRVFKNLRWHNNVRYGAFW